MLKYQNAGGNRREKYEEVIKVDYIQVSSETEHLQVYKMQHAIESLSVCTNEQDHITK